VTRRQFIYEEKKQNLEINYNMSDNKSSSKFGSLRDCIRGPFANWNMSKISQSSTFGVIDGRKCRSNKNISKSFYYQSNNKVNRRESDVSNQSYGDGDEDIDIISKPSLPYPGIFQHLKGSIKFRSN
jgi:hypothetical protein